MNYYSLKLRLWDTSILDEHSDGPKVYPQANGDRISNNNGYLSKGGNFGKIFFENVVDNAPVFDYFHLYSLSYQKEYDWILLDAYSYIGQNVPSCRGFLISERLKNMLEQFEISKPFRFYKSKLMFQGKKLPYYIFHLAQNEWNNLIFESSKYLELNENGNLTQLSVSVRNRKEFKFLFKESKNKQLIWKLKLKQHSDIFYFPFIDKGGYVISEKLKNRINELGFKGFQITKLDKVEFL